MIYLELDGRFTDMSNLSILLPEFLSLYFAFQVVDYILIIEGMPGQVNYSGLIDKPFSCRSIFNFVPSARAVNLAVYVEFHLRNTACRNLSFYPHMESGEDLERLESGIYHLLHVTHKFPVLGKVSLTALSV